MSLSILDHRLLMSARLNNPNFVISTDAVILFYIVISTERSEWRDLSDLLMYILSDFGQNGRFFMTFCLFKSLIANGIGVE